MGYNLQHFTTTVKLPSLRGLPKRKSCYKTKESSFHTCRGKSLEWGWTLSHLACCFTTLHKPTLTFRGKKLKCRFLNLKIHNIKEEVQLLLEPLYPKLDTRSPDHLTMHLEWQVPKCHFCRISEWQALGKQWGCERKYRGHCKLRFWSRQQASWELRCSLGCTSQNLTDVQHEGIPSSSIQEEPFFQKLGDRENFSY